MYRIGPQRNVVSALGHFLTFTVSMAQHVFTMVGFMLFPGTKFNKKFLKFQLRYFLWWKNCVFPRALYRLNSALKRTSTRSAAFGSFRYPASTSACVPSSRPSPRQRSETACCSGSLLMGIWWPPTYEISYCLWLNCGTSCCLCPISGIWSKNVSCLLHSVVKSDRAKYVFRQ